MVVIRAYLQSLGIVSEKINPLVTTGIPFATTGLEETVCAAVFTRIGFALKTTTNCVAETTIADAATRLGDTNTGSIVAVR